MKIKKLLCNIFLSSCLLSLPLCASAAAKDEAKDINNLKWWQKTVVYEAYPNSFLDTVGNGIGDLNGITAKLDYLQKLGVGAIWLTPIYTSPMGDNGYDVADYCAINPLYGTMADMENLIKEADKRGIKIVMDLVVNHTSEESQWFKESSSDKDSEYSDWYIWRDAAPDGKEPNNWGSIFGGSAWTWSEKRQQYYLHTFAPFQPDLNWANPKVRKAIYDVANFWLDKGVGGFRIDAVPYIKKPASFADGTIDKATGFAPIHNETANTPGILDYLHEFKQEVEEGKDIFTVGEANGVAADQLHQWVGKDGVFDMIFEFSHVNVKFADGEVWHKTKDWKLTELKQAIAASQANTASDGWYPIFFENHDQPRSVNNFLHEGADTVQGAKALGMLLMTLRGTPFLYQGEELGMSNVSWTSIKDFNDLSTHNQYKLALDNGHSHEGAIKIMQKHSRDNARTPMQWNNNEQAGFTTGKPWLAVNDNYELVNAEAEAADPGSVLSWYHKLHALRKANPVLIAGDYQELLADNEAIFAYTRNDENTQAIVLINFTGDTVSYPKELVADAKLLLSSCDGAKRGKLRPYEAVCWTKNIRN